MMRWFCDEVGLRRMCRCASWSSAIRAQRQVVIASGACGHRYRLRLFEPPAAASAAALPGLLRAWP
eukprot:8017638-Alexandrium_andersonii.AAC.1